MSKFLADMRATYGPYYGARILDRYMPGWADRIDLHNLTMDHIDWCIAGQLFRDRATEVEGDGFTWFVTRAACNDGWTGYTADERFGFNIIVDDPYFSTFGGLLDAWFDLIIERKTQPSVG